MNIPTITQLELRQRTAQLFYECLSESEQDRLVIKLHCQNDQDLLHLPAKFVHNVVTQAIALGV